jgi:RNA polymerase sigma-70 factor (ECF subfamily)
MLGNGQSRPVDTSGEFSSLLAAARAGVASAQERLIKRHGSALWHMARRELPPQLRVKVAPSDLVQDTYLEAHKKLHLFRGETEGEFTAWLSRILAHKLARARRHYQFSQKRDVRREAPAATSDEQLLRAIASRSTQSPGSQVATKEMLSLLGAALARLPQDYRQVVEMRNLQGRSFAAIGAAIGRTEEAARKVWARAIDRLARDLEGTSDGGFQP